MKKYPSYIVPLNIAKELKIIGFKSKVYFYYINDKEYRGLYTARKPENFNKNTTISIPVWEQIFEWFRKRGYEIISICDSQKARAMINLNPKSFKRVSHSMLRRLSEYIESNFYEGAITKLFDSCASSSSIDKELGIKKYWLVDIDCKNIEVFRKVQSIVNFCEPIEPNLQKVKGFTNSKNGYHIYTIPFNLKTFEDYKVNFKDLEQVEVKKDCLTNLYIP